MELNPTDSRFCQLLAALVVQRNFYVWFRRCKCNFVLLRFLVLKGFNVAIVTWNFQPLRPSEEVFREPAKRIQTSRSSIKVCMTQSLNSEGLLRASTGGLWKLNCQDRQLELSWHKLNIRRRILRASTGRLRKLKSLRLSWHKVYSTKKPSDLQ